MAFPRTSVTALLGLITVGVAGCGYGAQHTPSGRNFGLFFNQGGGSATLAYGPANSDDVGLVLQCQAGSGQVQVSDVAVAGQAGGLSLSSGGSRTDLGALVDQTMGQPMLLADVALTAPALQAFRRSGRIAVESSGGRYAIAAGRDERAGVERFFTACAKV